jgi:hypothetical protein
MAQNSMLKPSHQVADASVMKRTLTIMIAGLTAVFALGACGAASDAVGNGAKGALESATGCKVNGSNKNAKVECKGKNGKGSFSVGDGATVPDGFPKSDVPLPDGKIVSSISTDMNGKPAYVVTVKVDGAVGSTADAYKQTLVDKGFTADDNSSFSLGGSGGITTFKVTSSSWDVNVVGAGGTAGGSDNGLVVTVSQHDSTTDTTSSSS